MKKTHVPAMFIAALFTIARTWKQPRCPSQRNGIRSLYTTNGISLNHIKNKLESVLVRLMNLESVIRDEVSQKDLKKNIVY